MVFNELFCSFLACDGSLEPTALREWSRRADSTRTPLHIELVKSGALEEETAYQYLAEFFGYEYKFCPLTDVDLELIKKYPRELLIEYNAIPLSLTDVVLKVLCADPFKLEEFRELLYYGGEELVLVISPPSRMKTVLEYANNKIQQTNVLNNYSASESELAEVEVIPPIDAPIIKLCDSILRDAVARDVSDIHIEPFEKSVYIRFRLNGRLTRTDELSVRMFTALLARFKIMAGLNIAERRAPQDGKITTEINGEKYDFRVSTIPTLYGEKIAIRVYNRNFMSGDITSLGVSEKQKEIILKMITRPHGIILLTGPTGCGKSTTLYTFLRYLNAEDRNIVTVEDPVENEIEGINQVQVNPKAGLTFASALRSFLRQDPNVIMVGEIRDEETANVATRAAITGHLVLSSIHTNDAAGVVTRLINMGIPKYLVADSLLGSLSQRLVRRLCPKCKHRRSMTEAEMRTLGLITKKHIYDPVGCPYCNGSGYFGRVGVFEIMVLNDEIRDIIMADDYTSEKINNVLKGRSMTILDHARERVLEGEIDIAEYRSLVDVIM